MKSLLLFPAVLLALASAALAADAKKGFGLQSLFLYQPDEVLQSHVRDLDSFTAYIKQLQAVCTEYFATVQVPESLEIIVAVRPEKRSRVWFISSTHQPAAPDREPLRKKLEAVPPCDVHAGPIAFALMGNIAGGDGRLPKQAKAANPPLPKEWEDAAVGKGNVLAPDGFLDLIWPDKK